jgi:hypothetical protein
MSEGANTGGETPANGSEAGKGGRTAADAQRQHRESSCPQQTRSARKTHANRINRINQRLASSPLIAYRGGGCRRRFRSAHRRRSPAGPCLQQHGRAEVRREIDEMTREECSGQSSSHPHSTASRRPNRHTKRYQQASTDKHCAQTVSVLERRNNAIRRRHVVRAAACTEQGQEREARESE